MKHVLEAGCDGASLAIWDPAALPDDFDARKYDREFCDRLAEAGRLHWSDTGGDGDYPLHVYEGEGVPAHLSPHLRNPVEKPEFLIPSGKLYFAGAEYLFKKDDSFLRKYPHMGSVAEVKPGRWHLTLYETEYPDDLVEGVVRERVGRSALRLQNVMGCLASLAVLGVIGFLISIPALGWRRALTIALPVAAGLVALPILLSRWGPYRVLDERRREIEREYPDRVAVLKWLGPV